MKTEWDYTELAGAYLLRPDYSDAAVSGMLKLCGIPTEADVCDIGAGVAHLTLMLAKRGLRVTAVEPNNAMRNNGELRTRELNNVKWYEGTGENTGQRDNAFDLVTFGSSFNVCDRVAALKESIRVLRPNGWFACMWNHRNLEDPIQKKIETIIGQIIPDYNYGTRREDQTLVINSSGLFGPVIKIGGQVNHKQSIEDCVSAWRSHATLDRQAKGRFDEIIEQIENYLLSLGRDTIEIPYDTNVWIAQVR